MRINYNDGQIFKGYDVIKLNGLYMQGLTSASEKRIFAEMKKIAAKESLCLFINQNNTQICNNVYNNIEKDEKLSIWGQDRKAFVKKAGVPTILWNSEEPLLKNNNCHIFGNYSLEVKRAFSRGGNYYIGYKNDGEKWLLINSIDIYDEEAYKRSGDLPTAKMLPEMFDVKPENIYRFGEFFRDIDESVRPIGYPYILINDYDETYKNIEKLEKVFPNSSKILDRLKEYARTYGSVPLDGKIEQLKSFGFIPIKIGAHYEESINFINALAFKNNNNKISYITNSTKGSYPELEYLEYLFEEDIKTKVPDLEHIYFVSGGEQEPKPRNYLADFGINLSHGFDQENAIMDILANRYGGIHCMTAEIPDFDYYM